MSIGRAGPTKSISGDGDFSLSLEGVLPTMSNYVAAIHYVQQSTIIVEGKVREAIEEAVERTLASPEFSDSVAFDIQNLAQTVREIREGFRVVADGLISFDNEMYCGRDGEVLQLRPRWLAYQAVSDVSVVPPANTPVLTPMGILSDLMA